MKNDELYKNCTTTCTSGVENDLTSEKVKEFYDLMNNAKFKLVKRMEINPKFFKVLSKKVKIKEVTKVGYMLGMSVYIAPDLKEPYRFILLNNNADIAHLEEHLTCNENVEGSSPSVGSKEVV